MKPHSKPEVIYKPKHPVVNLTEDDIPHLHNIVNCGLLRTITPDHVAESLLERGLVRKAVGGLVATEIGHRSLMSWKRKDK